MILWGEGELMSVTQAMVAENLALKLNWTNAYVKGFNTLLPRRIHLDVRRMLRWPPSCPAAVSPCDFRTSKGSPITFTLHQYNY